MDSVIFTPAEIRELGRRSQGDYSDAHGTFTRKVKPKLQELRAVWIPQKKKIEHLLESKRKKEK